MKRLMLVLTMLSALASYTPAAVAATAHPGLPMISQSLRSGLARHASVRQLIPLSVSRSSARSGLITNTQQLRVAPNYMGVGSGWTMTVDQPMSPSQADTQTVQGTTLHPTISYTNLGAVGLYYEESVAPVQNSTSNYWITYLASYYTTTDNASAAFTDAISGWQTATPQSCTLPAGLPTPNQCSQVAFTPQNPAFVDQYGNVYRVGIRIVQISNALFEYGYLLEQSLFNANQNVANSNLDLQTQGIAALFTQSSTPTPQPTTVPTATPTRTPTTTPTPTPTPTQIPISYQIRAQWEKPSKQPNPNTKLSKVKHSTKVEPLVFVNVDSAPASQPLTVKLVVKQGSKTVVSKSGSFNLDAQDPTGLYDFGFTWKLPSKTGTYKLNATVTMGGQTARSSASLKVT